MASASGASRTQLDMMAEIIRENPHLKAKACIDIFKKRHRMTPAEATYYAAKRNMRREGILPDIAPAAASGEGPRPMMEEAPPATETIATEQETPQPPRGAEVSQASFVSDDLMRNIASIKEACDNAGGLTVAEHVATIIDASGGVANFLAAIALLREIGRTDASGEVSIKI